MIQPAGLVIGASVGDAVLVAGIVGLALCGFVLAIVLIRYGGLWFQAYVSGADVSVLSLVGMSFRQIKPGPIVTAKVMGAQAGLDIDRRTGMSTGRLEAHVLAGGDLMNVVRAIIAAQRADIDLDFDRAAAIDLAGRDVFDAVRTSVLPKVIDCPAPDAGGRSSISAIAKDGVELRIRALVTVRTNLKQLIGGATEETIIARVGQGIITSVGSAETHMEVMGMPDRISKSVLAAGLDTNTAFEIVSIDIADIDVGENIGARLQSDQAEADMRVAQALAEQRRVQAVAREQEMKARVSESRALRVLAEAEIPAAIAVAFRSGNIQRVRPSSGQFRPVTEFQTGAAGRN